MKRITLIFISIFLLAAIGQYSMGIYTRSRIIRSVESGTTLDQLISYLGNPLFIENGGTFPMDNMEILQEIPYEKDKVYAFWSKEGLPYWGGLVVASGPGNSVELVQIRVARWWGGKMKIYSRRKNS